MDDSLIGALGSLMSATAFLVGFSSVRLRGQRDRVLSRSDSATENLARASERATSVRDDQVLQTAAAFEDAEKLDPVGRWTLATAWAVAVLLLTLAVVGGINSGASPTMSVGDWSTDSWIVLVIVLVELAIAVLGTGDYKWVQRDLSQRLDGSPVRLAARALRERSSGKLDEALTTCAQLAARLPSWPWVHAFRSHVLAQAGDSGQALAALDRAIDLDISNPWWRVARAELRLKDGDALGAVRDLTLPELDLPQQTRVYRILGAALRAAGRRDEALDAFDRAVALDPESTETRLERGKALMQQGVAADHRLPTHSLIDMLLDDGEKVAVQVVARTGRENLRNWDIKKAIEDFDIVLRIDPTNVAALSGRSSARLKQGDESGSMEDFLEALRNSVSPDTVWVNRAKALVESGNTAAGIAAFGEALNVHATASRYIQRGLAKEEATDLEGALADYESALRLDAACADAASHRASALLTIGRREEARRAFRAVAEKRAHDAHNYDVWVSALLRNGMYEDALDVSNEALATLPESRLGRIYVLRARANRSLKRYRGALTDFERARELGCDAGEVAYGMAQTLADLDRIDEAIEALTPAVEHPSSMQYAALATRATLKRRLGAHDDARADLSWAIELQPGNARLLVSRACLLLLMDELAAAENDLERAAEIGGIERSRLYHQAMLYEKRGEYGDAMAALDACEAAGGDHGLMTKRRASYAFAAKDWVNAARYYRELAAEDTKALYSLGAAYDNMGEFESAEEIFREILTTETASMEARMGVAVTLSQQGKSSDAVAEFRALRALLGDGFEEFASKMLIEGLLLEARRVYADLEASAPPR